MTVPDLAMVPFTAARPDVPLLVVGPSLGTTTALWEPVAAELEPDLEVVGFDLPGHGQSPVASEAFTVTDLAYAVLELVANHRGPGPVFHYAGDSIGGAVGLALALQAPAQVLSLVPVCTGAKLGEIAGWRDRAQLVRAEGTGAVVEGSRQRWFAPGFADRAPQIAEGLLEELRRVDAESYALTCEALAGFDLRSELHRITAPTVVISGAEDIPAPPQVGAQIATAIPGAHHTVLDGVGHLAPVEAIREVVAVLRELTQSEVGKE